MKLIKQYPAVFEKSSDGFGIYIPNLDGCISYGDSLDDGVKNIREALTLYLSGMIEDGETVPDFNLMDIQRNIGKDEVLVMVEPDRTLLKKLIKKGKSKRVNITIDEYLLEFVDFRASELNTSRSALIESGLRAIL